MSTNTADLRHPSKNTFLQENHICWKLSRHLSLFLPLSSYASWYFCLNILLSFTLFLFSFAYFCLTGPFSPSPTLPCFVFLQYVCLQIPVFAFSKFLHLLSSCYLSFCLDTSLPLPPSFISILLSLFLSVSLFLFKIRGPDPEAGWGTENQRLLQSNFHDCWKWRG